MVYIGVPAWVLNKLLNGSTKNRKEKSEEMVSRKEKIKLYLMGLVGLVLAQIINTIFVCLFNIEQSEAMDTALSVPQSQLGILLYIVYLAIVPAIFEELLFRKVILSGAKKFGSVFAVIFTSVLFGLFHQNLQQTLGTTLIGLVLAIITLKTGDIKTSIAIHFTNNFFATLVQIAYANVESGVVTITTLVCVAFILVIAVLAFIGIILLIKTLITKKGMIKVSEDKDTVKVNVTSIFTNYYALILLTVIILTTVLNSKLS